MLAMNDRHCWHAVAVIVLAAGGSVRLSLRKLKMYGRVEISLTKEQCGKDLIAYWRRKKESRMSGAVARKANNMAQM